MAGNTSQEIENHLENLVNPQESKVATQTSKFEWKVIKDLIERKLSNSIDLDSDNEINFATIGANFIYTELLSPDF